MDRIQVEILNWEKFNPRVDRANYSWFRLQNDFFHNQSVFGLSALEKMVYLFVLCELSKKNKPKITIGLTYAAAILSITVKQTLEAFHTLSKVELVILSDDGEVTASSRHDDGEVTASSRHDDGEVTASSRHDDGIKPKRGNSKFDLESVYKKYPRKVGKQIGLAKAEREIRTDEDFAQLNQAIERFIEYHRQKATAAEFIPHFSTFMTSWRDWIDPQAGTSQDFSKTRFRPIEELLAEDEENQNASA